MFGYGYSQNIWMEMTSENAEIDRMGKQALDFEEFDKNFQKAISLTKRIEEKASKSGNKLLIAYSYNTYGTIFRMNKNTSLALRYYKKALKTLDNEHPTKTPFIYYNIYRTYVVNSDFKTALTYLFMMLKYYEKKNNLYGIGRVKTEIGELYLYMNNLKTSEKYIHEGKIIAEKLKDKNLIYLNNLCYINILLAKNNSKNALFYSKKYLNDIKQISDKKFLGYYYESISAIHETDKNYKAALDYIDSAIAITKKESEIVGYNISKANILMSAKKYPDSEIILTKAIKDAINVHRLDYELDAREKLIELYKKQSKSLESAKLIVENDKLKEKLIVQKNNNNLIALDYQYQLESKNKLINDYKTSSKRWIVMTFFILAILGIILIFIMIHIITLKKKNIKKDKRLEMIRRQKETTERELASNALLLIENKKLLENIKNELSAISISDAGKKKIHEIEKSISSSLQTEKNWKKTIMHFEKVDPIFFQKLKELCPDLSPSELKHCAYIRIQLNNKEVAMLLGIEPSSVKVARYRIKKKLNLSTEENLSDFISKL